MWLFKKIKNNGEQRANTAASDKIAVKIAGAAVTLQTKFADTMSMIFQNINVKRLKVLLFLFCLSAGGYSVYLIANAVTNAAKTEQSFKPSQINMPKHLNKSGEEFIAETKVDEETFYKIQNFKNYMDSLKQNKSYLYDSILSARPFLIDTVLMLEEIYYSQKQK
jgi:hypothetical protein